MMEVTACCVCGAAVDETSSAVCNSCGRRYHLNLRSDREGRDCGDVWLNEEFLALEFGCYVCLRGEKPAQGSLEPPVGRSH